MMSLTFIWSYALWAIQWFDDQHTHFHYLNVVDELKCLKSSSISDSFKVYFLDSIFISVNM